MRLAGLIKNNLRYYWRTNLAVIAGVAIAVAVLAGALLVGDSVQASLRKLFLQRLGKTNELVTSPHFFREQLAADIQGHSQFASFHFEATVPLIALEGNVSEASGTRAGAVQVYGVDERFWKFHGREGKAPPQNREVFLSQSLARELNSKVGDSVLVRIEKPSEVPRESLYGRKDDPGKTLRLTVKELLSAEDLGEFSLRPQQGAVRAVFVPLSLLQRELDQSGRVNTILISGSHTNSETARPVSTTLLLQGNATLDDYDVKVRPLEAEHGISVERGSTLIDDLLANKVFEAADSSKMRVAPVFSYVVNGLTDGSKSIPYSLVSALDDQSFQNLFPGEKYVLQPSQNRPQNQIILNEWAAHDLGAHEGDSITLEYFVWQDDGQLATQTAKFQVAAIVPISGAAADRNLVPDYPGISESESMSDWDPPFPVDLERIRKQDEDYWKQYRTTPKAFIRLEDGQKLWQSRFGKFTSIRLMPDASTPLDQAVANFGGKLRQGLNPAVMGLVMSPVRQQGLAASRGATDFGEYFLYFSFFLVISALLLTSLFFKLGIEQRVREIGVLEAVGFPAERIRFIFLIEGLLLSIIGSVAGLLGAVAYGQLMMYGLRTWWIDAVGTSNLQLHVSAQSLLLGAAGGVVAAVLCVFWTLRKLKRLSTRSLLLGSIAESGLSKDAQAMWHGRLARVRRRFGKSRFGLALILTVVGLLLLAGAFLHLINQTAGFFGGGTVFLIALLCYVSALLKKPSAKPIQGAGFASLSRLGFRNTTYRAGRSVLCIALIASATFIIVAVDAFRRDNQKGPQERKSGSGGFPLMAESLLPLIHDPNSAAGREAMNLSGDTNVAVLNGVQFARFRLRPGDDASCLNLYQPHNPRILGASDEFIKANRFAFQSTLPGSKEETDNPWLMLGRSIENDVIPVIADANSLTYVLHLQLGDEFVLNRSEGSLRLRIVGALADSIFQSELIMSENNFKNVFPHEEGHRFFLIDAPENQQAAVSAVLEDRLSDFGFDVVPTEERLASFHRVENTYLSTFQMLGGLGLLLGTLGMAAVLLRNILERRRELALLRAVGYNSTHFTMMITAENALLLCTGLGIGVVAATLAITPILISRGGKPFNLSLGVLLIAVLISGLSASIVATWSALRSPILPPLRAE